MGDDIVKTSLTLTKDELETLQRLAAEYGVTVAEMIRRAISEEAFFVEAVEDGGRVLLEDKDKSLKELVIR
jgi:hypothetical protein